jgi:hypothetical protein
MISLFAKQHLLTVLTVVERANLSARTWPRIIVRGGVGFVHIEGEKRK